MAVTSPPMMTPPPATDLSDEWCFTIFLFSHSAGASAASSSSALSDGRSGSFSDGGSAIVVSGSGFWSRARDLELGDGSGKGDPLAPVWSVKKNADSVRRASRNFLPMMRSKKCQCAEICDFVLDFFGRKWGFSVELTVSWETGDRVFIDGTPTPPPPTPTAGCGAHESAIKFLLKVAFLRSEFSREGSLF